MKKIVRFYIQSYFIKDDCLSSVDASFILVKLIKTWSSQASDFTTLVKFHLKFGPL